MATKWSEDNIVDPLYRTKFIDVPDIINDWLDGVGGFSGKDVLEFGCGEGTMALGVALRKGARRVVGVEVLDVYRECLPIARRQLSLSELPDNLSLCQIEPGEDLKAFGQFDVVYSWSAFEHVDQALLPRAFASIRAIVKLCGTFFLQISPLYYSANGSHMGPWIPEPWAHLWMQGNQFQRRLLTAAETSPEVRNEWSVYIPADADTTAERSALWDTYVALNRVTVHQLRHLARQAGFEIVREYRTLCDAAPPPELAEIYDAEALVTEQIVLLMTNPPAEGARQLEKCDQIKKPCCDA